MRLDLTAICTFRRGEAYWARWRPDDVIAAQVRTAWRVAGAYTSDGAQVSFAWAVSDGYAVPASEL
jgi:hypothetical protein